MNKKAVAYVTVGGSGSLEILVDGEVPKITSKVTVKPSKLVFTSVDVQQIISKPCVNILIPESNQPVNLSS
jgi:hypothetical protein